MIRRALELLGVPVPDVVALAIVVGLVGVALFLFSEQSVEVAHRANARRGRR